MMQQFSEDAPPDFAEVEALHKKNVSKQIKCKPWVSVHCSSFRCKFPWLKSALVYRELQSASDKLVLKTPYENLW